MILWPDMFSAMLGPCVLPGIGGLLVSPGGVLVSPGGLLVSPAKAVIDKTMMRRKPAVSR